MSVPSSPPPVTFAHPSEAEIARLLDFYGVQWEYEPRSFPLEWNAEGSATRFFTPDFYLPEYELYLEVTTIRPALIARKHRKLRRFREVYPDVMIKLLNCKDVEALLTKYGRQRGGSIADGEAIKNLSGTESSADCPEVPLRPSASLSIQTDLATHRDSAETEV